MRPIDADIIIKNLTGMKSYYDAIALDGMIKALQEAPTIKPETVVHGEWIVTDTLDEFVEYNCSNCGHGITVDTFIDETTSNFCPHCGAYMRAEEETP